MTDAEFVFNQTSAERKRNGRGAFNKVRQGGKYVRFPSDGLSRKEKAKLNGEVVKYSFVAPLKWEEFRAMPKDIQQNYLDLIRIYRDKTHQIDKVIKTSEALLTIQPNHWYILHDLIPYLCYQTTELF